MTVYFIGSAKGLSKTFKRIKRDANGNIIHDCNEQHCDCSIDENKNKEWCVDCSQFKNRGVCNCSREANKKLPWCRTTDTLYETKNCDNACSKDGTTKCALHIRSDFDYNLKMYYCQPTQ